MVLAVLSDIHGATSRLAKVAQDLQAYNSRSKESLVIILSGDLSHLGGALEAEAVLCPLEETGFPVLAIPGNMDRPEIAHHLASKGIDLHGRGRIVQGIGFQGLGGCGLTPFGTPFEHTPEEAADLLEKGHCMLEGAAYKVLVSHAPPASTNLDRLFTGLHAGCPAVRAFLETGGIDLCLSGHIHESPGTDKVGRAFCLNPGPFREGRYCLVILEGAESGKTRIDVDWRRL